MRSSWTGIPCRGLFRTSRGRICSSSAGTSLAVYPAASLVNYYRGHRLVLINKSPIPYDAHADLVIAGPIGEILGGVAVV